jgi:LysM repeat protein
MSALRQVTLGILAAVLSVGIILGSLSLALTEGNLSVSRTLSATPTLTSTIFTPEGPVAEASPTVEVATLAALVELSPTPSPILTSTPTPPIPTNCPPPDGWSPVTVQAGDSLEGLAEFYNTLPGTLAEANCLLTQDLIPGVVLYVPGIPPTEPPVQCGPPYGWVLYTVRPGDTLYALSKIFGVTVFQLQSANCLGNSTLIRVGQRLYVPFLPPSPPHPTPTPRPTFTLQPSEIPSDTPSFSPTPTLGVSDTPIPSLSPTLPPPPSTLTPTPSLIPTDPSPPTGTPTAEVTDVLPRPSPTPGLGMNHAPFSYYSKRDCPSRWTDLRWLTQMPMVTVNCW